MEVPSANDRALPADLGWSVVPDLAGTLLLVDRTGTVAGWLIAATSAPATARFPLPNGWTGTLALPDGRSTTVSNGNSNGIRLVHRTARVRLDSNEWTYQHLTGAAALIWRDGIELAELHRRRAVRSGRMQPGQPLPVTYRLARCGQLYPIDELMITLFGLVFGPPGRAGGLSTVADAVGQAGL